VRACACVCVCDGWVGQGDRIIAPQVQLRTALSGKGGGGRGLICKPRLLELENLADQDNHNRFLFFFTPHTLVFLQQHLTPWYSCNTTSHLCVLTPTTPHTLVFLQQYQPKRCEILLQEYLPRLRVHTNFVFTPTSCSHQLRVHTNYASHLGILETIPTQKWS